MDMEECVWMCVRVSERVRMCMNFASCILSVTYTLHLKSISKPLDMDSCRQWQYSAPNPTMHSKRGKRERQMGERNGKSNCRFARAVEAALLCVCVCVCMCVCMYVCVCMCVVFVSMATENGE